MTVQSGLVPLLDEQTGRFPDEFAPPSVAADAAAARDAAEAAELAQEAAEAAENNAAEHEREAGQIVEDATATIPGLISEQVTAQIDPKVSAATQAKTDAETAQGAAQTARDDALQAKAQAVAARADTIAALAATEVEQITLTGNLALTVPEGHPAGQVYRCAITQTTGGHTVTYGGSPVSVDLTAGASTTVELHPVGGGYVIRYPAPDAPTAAGRALLIAADATAQRESMDVLSRAVDRSRRGRENAARWTLAADSLAKLANIGLTTIGDHIGAAVAGTYGDAVLPIWRPNGDFRTSFRVKATKSVPGSISGVGFTAGTARASLPGVSDVAWVVGYVQGSGIAVKPYNVSGGAVSVIAVPDTSITDGQEWDVSVWMDPYLNIRASSNNSTYIRAVPAAGGNEYRQTLNTYGDYLPTNALIRTNAGDSVLTRVEICTHPTGEIGLPTVGTGRYFAGVPSENLALRIPARPNGKLVFALHGHGSTGEVISRTSYMMDSWQALNDAGFTIAFPDFGGNSWANDAAMAYLVEAHRILTAECYGLDPEVYLYGISMGGGTSLTAIAKRIIPVRAAYLAHPSCDMRSRWANPATWPTLQTAYAGVEADMLDNNPMSQPPSLFAGVPMLFTASPGDTTTPKAEHTDAFRALLGSVTPNYLITVTGDHMDPSHFRAQDALNFFRANL